MGPHSASAAVRHYFAALVLSTTAFSNALLAAEPVDAAAAAKPAGEARPFLDEADKRFWLENMVWHHRYSVAEIGEVTGLTDAQITAELIALKIRAETRPERPADAPLLTLPYPGGRHPRIGFLDGALRPQRETKISVFTPWDATKRGETGENETSYVVVDMPEAIWSNLGLTYLAHTHVPTIWSKQKIEMERLEWRRRNDGTYDIERRLPNGIEFGAKVMPRRDRVELELWLKNGTQETLSDLRVQNCVMLKGAPGFEEQSNDNKIFEKPFVAARSKSGDRWVITTWTDCHRAWGNPPCPCLHADPKFPDCEPGATRRLRGWLSFYEGKDPRAEFTRIAKRMERTD
jgi:hypothetical protein